MAKADAHAVHGTWADARGTQAVVRKFNLERPVVAERHHCIPRKLQAAALPCGLWLLAVFAVPPFRLGLRDGFRALRAIVGMMFG